MGRLEISGVLLDMDGTIIDSENFWATAERELVESFGGNWSKQDGLSLAGSSLENAALKLRAAGVRRGIAEIIEFMSDRVIEQIRQRVPWRTGVVDFLRNLKDAGVSCALVTNSTRDIADHVAQAVHEELGSPFFRSIVCSEDIDRPKPDPEAYLKATELLCTTADQVVAIEDSVPGARSARASGAITIGVPLHKNIPEDSVHALWKSFAGKTFGDVQQVWLKHRGGIPR